MGRLIDTDEYEKRIKPYDAEDVMDKALYNFAHEKLVTTPTAQPEIIRCKDCENLQTDWKPLLPDRHYCGVMDSMMKEDDFCSYAERKEDAFNSRNKIC